jgi:SpoVK/Ycf46/Vps4 family AAA+-type ATPase
MKAIDFKTDQEIKLIEENQKLKQIISEIAVKHPDLLTTSILRDSKIIFLCDYPMNDKG